jgi:hypothetical protein
MALRQEALRYAAPMPQAVRALRGVTTTTAGAESVAEADLHG